MKVLVAPATAGTAPDDFHWAVPGELLTIPIECANPECGCDRCFTGATSRAGTTTAIVADLPLTRAEYAQALDDGDRAANGQRPRRRGRISGDATARADDLLRIAGLFDVGDVVERSGRTIEAR